MKLGAQTAVWLGEKLLARRTEIAYLDLVNESTNKQIRRLDVDQHQDDSAFVDSGLSWVEQELAPLDGTFPVRIRMYGSGGKYLESKNCVLDEQPTALAPVAAPGSVAVPALSPEERLIMGYERYVGILERGHELMERRYDAFDRRVEAFSARAERVVDQLTSQNQRLADDLSRANQSYTDLATSVLEAKVEEIRQAQEQAASQASEGDSWERLLDKGTHTIKSLYAAHKGVPDRLLDMLAAAALDPEVSSALADDSFVENLNLDTLRSLVRMHRAQQESPS